MNFSLKRHQYSMTNPHEQKISKNFRFWQRNDELPARIIRLQSTNSIGLPVWRTVTPSAPLFGIWPLCMREEPSLSTWRALGEKRGRPKTLTESAKKRRLTQRNTKANARKAYIWCPSRTLEHSSGPIVRQRCETSWTFARLVSSRKCGFRRGAETFGNIL